MRKSMKQKSNKSNKSNKSDNFDRHNGRKIVVNGVEWKYTVSDKGTVLAYSKTGQRACVHGCFINGTNDPNILDRGQYKKTRDGMITPKHIAEWLKKV